MSRPLVAVTMGRRLGPAGTSPARVRPARMEVVSKEALVTALQRAGAHAVLVPPTTEPDRDFLQVFSGVLLAGGAFDIHPRHYGQMVEGRLDAPDEDRTHTELHLARACLAHNVPVLGICGGLQALAVAAGGTLHQHIPHAFPHAVDHEQPTDPATGATSRLPTATCAPCSETPFRSTAPTTRPSISRGSSASRVAAPTGWSRPLRAPDDSVWACSGTPSCWAPPNKPCSMPLWRRAHRPRQAEETAIEPRKRQKDRRFTVSVARPIR